MTRYYTWCYINQYTRAAFQTLKSQTTRAFYEYFGEKGYEDIRLLCICNHIMTGIDFLSYLNRDWNTFSRKGPWGQHNSNWHTHLDQNEMNKHTQLSQSFSDHFFKTSSIRGSMSHEHVMIWKRSPHYWHFVSANRLWCIPLTKHHQAMQSSDDFFDVNLNELFNNQASYRWFETPRHPWTNSVEMSLDIQKPKHIMMTSHERQVVSKSPVIRLFI